MVHLECGILEIPEMMSDRFSEKRENNIDNLFQFYLHSR